MKPAIDHAADGDAPITYRIEPFDPKGHRFRVGLLIRTQALAQDKVLLRLAAWIPGSYMIREFAKHVLSIEAYWLDETERFSTGDIREAVAASGQSMKLVKTAKAQWEIQVLADPGSDKAFDPKKHTIYVEALIYAGDLSVRAAHLDQSHGFFNPTSLCLRVLGAEQLPCALELIAPDPESVTGSWEVATTLARPAGGASPWGFGLYRANEYDELADHPVEMGTFSRFRFEACGVPHWLVVTGKHRFDAARVCHDLQSLCETQIRFFDAQRKAPFEQFMFLLTVLGEAYGGLEHRDSTALICRRDDLPPPQSLKLASDGSASSSQDEPSEGYRRFLGLASHEYFHAWHVKRIKPAVFVRYDFDQENYTRLLWIFEGFTSYYDDLMLLRAGVISRTSYLSSLEATINQVLKNPSRRGESLSDASFDAWIKYYRQDENAANAVVSYYAKGALVALCIDLLIRQITRERASLDHLMRLLWTRYGEPFYRVPATHPDADEHRGSLRPDKGRRGLDEDGFFQVLFEACKIRSKTRQLALVRDIGDWVEGRVDLPLEPLLAKVSVKLSRQLSSLSHGMRFRIHEQDMLITAVLNGSAAHEAGLSAGDRLVAVDGLRASEASLNEAIKRCDGPIEIFAFRRDELF
ncbi:MAG: M61 family peptidase, partial [Betaproteobacteria bacterium]|nr:M61 family peptidase [Betaproteobacteria bacterium]